MWQLVINTSHKHLSIGLLENNHFVDGIHEEAFKTQSEMILPRLKQLLENHQLTPMDLHQIYVGLGPGSYTGVRIGLTVVKTLALVSVIEVSTFNSFDFFLPLDTGTVLLDARSSRAYVGIKSNSKWTFQGILTLDEVKERLIEPYFQDAQLIDMKAMEVSLSKMCENIVHHSERCNDVHALEPLYIKAL